MVIDLHNKIRLGFPLNLIVWKMKWAETGCNRRILFEVVWGKEITSKSAFLF